jgi:hypothetical protein
VTSSLCHQRIRSLQCWDSRSLDSLDASRQNETERTPPCAAAFEGRSAGKATHSPSGLHSVFFVRACPLAVRLQPVAGRQLLDRHDTIFASGLRLGLPFRPREVDVPFQQARRWIVGGQAGDTFTCVLPPPPGDLAVAAASVRPSQAVALNAPELPSCGGGKKCAFAAHCLRTLPSCASMCSRVADRAPQIHRALVKCCWLHAHIVVVVVVVFFPLRHYNNRNSCDHCGGLVAAFLCWCRCVGFRWRRGVVVCFFSGMVVAAPVGVCSINSLLNSGLLSFFFHE